MVGDRAWVSGGKRGYGYWWGNKNGLVVETGRGKCWGNGAGLILRERGHGSAVGKQRSVSGGRGEGVSSANVGRKGLVAV